MAQLVRVQLDSPLRFDPSVLEQTRPDKVYTNAGSDFPFVELLDKTMIQLHPDSAYASAGALVENYTKKDFAPGKGHQLLQKVHVVEGGAYTATWSREGSEQLNTTDEAEDDSLAERVMKKPRTGYGPVGPETLIADQNRRNANIRLEAFLTNLDSSHITVSKI